MFVVWFVVVLVIAMYVYEDLTGTKFSFGLFKSEDGWCVMKEMLKGKSAKEVFALTKKVSPPQYGGLGNWRSTCTIGGEDCLIYFKCSEGEDFPVANLEEYLDAVTYKGGEVWRKTCL